jgi:hypothetical protein
MTLRMLFDVLLIGTLVSVHFAGRNFLAQKLWGATLSLVAGIFLLLGMFWIANLDTRGSDPSVQFGPVSRALLESLRK